VPLKPAPDRQQIGFDALEARLKLGPERDASPGIKLVLARSAAGTPYDRLVIDANGDGALNETPITTTPEVVRRQYWTRFSASLNVAHVKLGSAVVDDYPVSLWVVVEKPDAIPDVIRIGRRGYKSGSATIDGVPMDVVISDGNNDAVFGPGDWWTIMPASSTAVHSSELSRKVGDFAWAAGKAWKLELQGTAGRVGRLVPFDPGMTEAQDQEARDMYRADRLAPRAKTPVVFSKDYETALADARSKGAAYFLDFETTWCGPCALMDKYVYTAEPVAKAAQGTVCIKIDGDDHKDLKERYKVDSFPTGILFDENGKEIGRFIGYSGVREMQALFSKAKR
jgi:thiol-disulfide isomerase/thioredoxin